MLQPVLTFDLENQTTLAVTDRMGKSFRERSGFLTRLGYCSKILTCT